MSFPEFLVFYWKVWPSRSKMNAFSERVKEVRNQLKISQEDLAHALGVSFATVNRWENGKTKPSKLALRQFDLYCAEQYRKGRIHRSGDDS